MANAPATVATMIVFRMFTSPSMLVEGSPTHRLVLPVASGGARAAAGPAATTPTATASAPTTNKHFKRSIPTSISSFRDDCPTPSLTGVPVTVEQGVVESR